MSSFVFVVPAPGRRVNQDVSRESPGLSRTQQGDDDVARWETRPHLVLPYGAGTRRPCNPQGVELVVCSDRCLA